jgi:hypothetical protein
VGGLLNKVQASKLLAEDRAREGLVRAHLEKRFMISGPVLEATQVQMDGVFSQLPYKCHLEEVTSVGD